jgi:tRNA pseudouridine38-40 synthase
MARFKLYIEYDGTRYSGWQIQSNARTIQGEISSALRSIFQKEKFDFQGAGRTDAGVHALAQVAHLEAPTVLAPEIIRMKLNDALPADVNILEVEKAPPSFHARHDALSRSYLYQISRRRTAFGKRFVWWIKDRLDVKKMHEATVLFEGMKDFQSFTDDDPGEKPTSVLIEHISLHERDALLLLRVQGSHFLWKMVRRMAGVIADAGRGQLSMAQLAAFLKEKSDEPARHTAPPSGLFLEKVLYKGDGPLDPPMPAFRIPYV